MNIIARCNCGGVMTYTANSAKLLNLPDPDETLVGKEKIRAFAAKYPDTPLDQHLQVISKKSGRYAFYLSVNDANEITAMYNMISGKKVY